MVFLHSGARGFDLGGGFQHSGNYPMVFLHSGARDFDLGGGFQHSGNYPMVFLHSGRTFAVTSLASTPILIKPTLDGTSTIVDQEHLLHGGPTLTYLGRTPTRHGNKDHTPGRFSAPHMVFKYGHRASLRARGGSRHNGVLAKKPSLSPRRVWAIPSRSVS
jgi:hypothetical protein